MKLTFKLILVVAIFSSVALAEEGNMGSGGKSCPSGGTGCREAQSIDTTANDKNQDDSILNAIRDYLISLFG